MSARQPFAPTFGSGQNVTANASSASVSIKKNNKQVRIINTGANPAQIRTGQTTATATTADFHITSGAIEVITKPDDHDVIAYISASGTTLNIMSGEGW